MDEYVFGQFRCIFCRKEKYDTLFVDCDRAYGHGNNFKCTEYETIDSRRRAGDRSKRNRSALFPVNITSTTKTAPTAAAGAVLRCTVRRINSMPAAAGPASTMKFRVPCAANRMPTDAVRRFSAPSAEPIWATSLRAKDLPLKIRAIA